MQHNYRSSINEAIQLLSKQDNKFVEVFANGNMLVEYYVPKIVDEQTPHKKDELYIIATGTSNFLRDTETIKCIKGDIIFVPAHMEHRFINFSDDFATWVIFYGEEKELYSMN